VAQSLHPTAAHTDRLAQPPAGLPDAASLLLDIIRFCAALAVVVEHVCLEDFGTGARDRQLWGYVAVPVFFVLSGFIIRFVTATRETTLREYAIDRVSRIYSVVLPTLVISAAIGSLCWRLNPHRFLEIWRVTFQHSFSRVLLNLAFFSQAWGMDASPFLDRPFWSLGYECIYYALFGIAFFLRGWQRAVLLLLLALAIGPNVLLLFPVWILGCLAYDAYIRLRQTSARVWLPLGTFSAGLITFALYLLDAAGVREIPPRVMRWILHLPNPVGMMGLSLKHASMLNLAFGVAAAPVLLILLLAAEVLPIRLDHALVKAMRRVAEGTFVLYLLHYPLLVLAYCLGGLGFRTWGRNTFTVTAICVFLVLLSPVFDTLKRVMRRSLRKHLPRAAKPQVMIQA
jgi:peptidoglycan/LPS O-acetylase OafA/YrhL